MPRVSSKTSIHIYARLFGEFEMSDGTEKLTQEEIRSDMVTKLCAYLISRHDKSCSAQELADVFWPEGSSGNPAGALKNLMYRVRKTTEKVWPGISFFTTGHGSYQWNRDIPVTVDAEEMDSLILRAESEHDENKKISMLMDAVSLYRGKLLVNYSNEYWVMSAQAYSHGQYLKAVKDLCRILALHGRFDTMEQAASKAIEQDQLDEELHCLLMRAYIGENRQQMAQAHYHETVKLLYDSLGVEPSDELRNIYNEAMKQMHNQEADLESIQADLREEQRKKGAFYCEYGVFKKIYELEVRRVGRIGMSVYLSLITMNVDQKPKAGETENELNGRAMDQMQEVLMSCLRSGDLITRYSSSQFLVMLQGCDYENAKRVMNRVNGRYYDMHRHVRAGIQYSLKEMEL